MGAQDLISVIQTGFSQTDRLVKLDTPAGQDALLPLRVIGNARLGRNFSFTIDVASLNSTLELKTLIAQPVTLWVQQADKSYLPFHGYVHSARRLGADGGLSFYQLSFSSWLHFLKFRKDARIFQDKTPDQILSEVFRGHPQAQGAFRFEVQKAAPARSYCTQYEDDWNFAQRLMESEGWFGYFEQAADGKGHTFVITDDLYSIKSLTPSSVEFYRAGVTGEPMALTQWTGTRTLQSVVYSPTTFDYKAPGSSKTNSFPTVDNQGDLPGQAEVYEYTGPYTYLDSGRGDRLTKLKLEEWESRAKRFSGVGGVRQLQVGYWFTLENHPEHDRDRPQDREFSTLAVDVYIENNLPIGNSRAFPHSLQTRLAGIRAQNETAGAAGDAKNLAGSEGFFVVEVEAQRRIVPFRSPFEHAKPLMQTQTAIVVGPTNAEVFTDDLNRVKVKMHWDRISAGDQSSSCWMRVMYPHAGGDFGGVFTPRVGQEVAITYLEGDCDRPVISGCLFNGNQKPQWHSNGLMSGLKSKEYQGTGYNQLVMDDSTGQNRAQLFSSTSQSYLHLGYLIDQQGNTRGSYLGTGFDLKTDSYGAVRASQGMYLSTYSRVGTSSQPLDVKEAHQHLVESGGVVERRSEVATGGQAESLQDAQDTINDFAAATQSARQATSSGGNTAGGGTGEANGFAQPVMLLASPSGIGLSTQKSIQAAATEHVNIVSGASTHIAASRSLIASVGEKLSLFVQNAGMKLFAGKGKVELHAQSDNVEITADRTVKVISTSDAVNVMADKEIKLMAGGATIRLSGGNIYIHAPGLVEIKGTQHSFQGPASENAAVQLPVTEACAQKFASASQAGAAIVD